MSEAAGSVTPADIAKLWDFADPAATEQKFSDLLPTTPEGSGIRLQLLTQIARTLGLQKKFDDAHGVLDDVERSLDAAPPVLRVRCLLERGRVFNSSQLRERAKPLFVAAWDLARDIREDGLAVDAAHMVAIVEPPDEALAWNKKAIEFAEASDQPSARQWLGSLYNNTGWTHHDRGEPAVALDYFQRALALREQQGQAGPIRIARWCVARALRSLGRIDEALAMQQGLLREYQAAAASDGYVFEELGECLLALGKASEAAPHFARAYEELSKDAWLPQDDPQRLARLKELGAAASSSST